jgi:REP element-mobilizing transposase RayT
MSHDFGNHHRRSTRLKGYDYSQDGAYFVTVCTQDRECLFGDVVDGEMRLNLAGRMVQAVWDDIPSFYPGVETDAFVVMPNHIHAIIIVLGSVGAAPRGRPCHGRPGSGQPQGVAPTLSLPDAVHRFKTMTTKRYSDGVRQSGWPAYRRRLWQRNYYDHIIRGERSMDRIRQYIATNPMCWEIDQENPNANRSTT